MRGANKLQLLLNEDAVDFAIYRGDEEQTLYTHSARTAHLFNSILKWKDIIPASSEGEALN